MNKVTVEYRGKMFEVSTDAFPNYMTPLEYVELMERDRQEKCCNCCGCDEEPDLVYDWDEAQWWCGYCYSSQHVTEEVA